MTIALVFCNTAAQLKLQHDTYKHTIQEVSQSPISGHVTAFGQRSEMSNSDLLTFITLCIPKLALACVSKECTVIAFAGVLWWRNLWFSRIVIPVSYYGNRSVFAKRLKIWMAAIVEIYQLRLHIILEYTTVFGRALLRATCSPVRVYSALLLLGAYYYYKSSDHSDASLKLQGH